ncbi:tryptophan halogenase family protein [Niveispirillum sp. KHB5.9]|uniref:tryptophan halogenase family protein n=1 Tax=Niveispirillum sp. KHB5.9 TaxID=3400269 RepID=UPI003A84CC70
MKINNTNTPPKVRVLIVGGGTSGWMAASALSAKLAGTGVSIRLVESAEIGTVGVGEATVPHIRHFNASLGLDEADFMSRTEATFKLGIEFRDWGRKGDAYVHPFAAFGRDIGGVPFHHHWTRAHRAGRTPAGGLDDVSLPIQALRMGRFGHPSPDPSNFFSTFSYAYQFDAGLYAAYLRSYAEARGVVRTEGKVREVALRDDGHVDAVVMESGERIEADLFVDCSGFRGLIIEGALKTGYEDWTRWLPCDRAVAVPCANDGPPSPYTRATSRESGWMWRIPLQHRAGNGHVYCSGFIDDDAAEAALLAQLENPAQAAPRRLRFTTGKRKRQWVGNCVSIGLAAGFLEPLESTSIHLIQLGIGRLLDLFPTSPVMDPLDAAEFNRLMALEYERVRDFIVLHYVATQRDDTPFWNHCRTMAIPDSLATKMELFKQRGVVTLYRDGMFLEPSWLAVYLGQNILPDQVDPRAALVADADVDRVIAAEIESCRRAASSMPLQSEILSRYRMQVPA